MGGQMRERMQETTPEQRREWMQQSRDMQGQMRRLAAFLDIRLDESRWDRIVEYCTFDWMKANATKSVPLGGAFWDAGAEVFIHKGVNGRWKDTLSADEVDVFDLAQDAAVHGVGEPHVEGQEVGGPAVGGRAVLGARLSEAREVYEEGL